MEVMMQSSILIVSDLDRSMEFYTGVFAFPLMLRRDRVAALEISQAEWSQVLILRESPNRSARQPGRGSIGVRVLGFEVASVEELDQVHGRLTDRHAYVGRRQHDTRPTQIADWTYLDEMIEAIAQ